ncbi:MAG: T9SS type A sorting domain-containing protein [Cytophagales bacterium]|nr:T9SS type A sorting domain-containing protein [Cytophagales bacterium]
MTTLKQLTILLGLIPFTFNAIAQSGYDDCSDAVNNLIIQGQSYSWDTGAATGEDISGGGSGYFECGEGDNPENSVYFYFQTNSTGGDITLNITNANIPGSCILGTNPTDGFTVSVFEDATPCDNNADAATDCQSFDNCDGQPINWFNTYNGLAANTTYIIQIDGGLGATGGTATGNLSVTGNITLPVTWSGFDLTNLKNEGVQISWQTATESNNDFFTVERSLDGIEWEQLFFVDGANNSITSKNYSIIDHSPIMGWSYYRIKQTDFDGQFEYTGIKSNLMEEQIALNFYPNPTKDYLTITGKTSEISDVAIYNSVGQNIMNSIPVRKHDSKQVELNLIALRVGNYYLKTKESGHIIRKR